MDSDDSETLHSEVSLDGRPWGPQALTRIANEPWSCSKNLDKLLSLGLQSFCFSKTWTREQLEQQHVML